jgi:hypothetical protein
MQFVSESGEDVCLCPTLVLYADHALFNVRDVGCSFKEIHLTPVKVD